MNHETRASQHVEMTADAMKRVQRRRDEWAQACQKVHDSLRRAAAVLADAGEGMRPVACTERHSALGTSFRLAFENQPVAPRTQHAPNFMEEGAALIVSPTPHGRVRFVYMSPLLHSGSGGGVRKREVLGVCEPDEALAQCWLHIEAFCERAHKEHWTSASEDDLLHLF